ncbi:FIG01182173: hypothetical protein [hydrothermal vent metagenome]|uniref:DUF302 domain-containing protein n=1 Tax=hydrothermal vent metagenome TaxID=652676 RepID=A0A3B0ZLV8_9ZZZZ
MKMMKRILSLLMLSSCLLLANGVQAADRIKPFVLASKSTGDFDAKVGATRAALDVAGFEIVGEYSPYSDTYVDNVQIIVVTNAELRKAALMSEFAGFAAPWRVAVTQVGGEIQVTYANPLYIANAYRLKSDLSNTNEALKDALGAQETFGSRKGLTARKLRKYHYTFGMEYFDDPYELAEYDSHREALKVLEKNLAAGVAGVTQVYRLDLSDNVSVFGVARKAPSEAEQAMDEGWIMNIVDFTELKGTAYLPIEILVEGDEIYALHMRFRMAVHFPDLKMMGANSFMNIMSSPAAVDKALTAVAGGD